MALHSCMVESCGHSSSRQDVPHHTSFYVLKFRYQHALTLLTSCKTNLGKKVASYNFWTCGRRRASPAWNGGCTFSLSRLLLRSWPDGRKGWTLHRTRMRRRAKESPPENDRVAICGNSLSLKSRGRWSEGAGNDMPNSLSLEQHGHRVGQMD